MPWIIQVSRACSFTLFGGLTMSTPKDDDFVVDREAVNPGMVQSFMNDLLGVNDNDTYHTTVTDSDGNVVGEGWGNTQDEADKNAGV